MMKRFFVVMLVLLRSVCFSNAKEYRLQFNKYDVEVLTTKKQSLRFLAQVYYKTGEYYYKNNKDKLAIKYYVKVDSLFNHYKTVPDLSAKTKVRLVDLLFRVNNWKDVGQLPQIEKYLNEGLEICASFNLSKPKSQLYLQFGVLHRYKRDYDRALYFYKKAIRTARENKEVVTEAVVYNDIAIMYAYSLMKRDSAEANFLRAAKINKAHTDTLNLMVMSLQTANFYSIYKKPRKAIQYLSFAENLSKGRTDLRREDCFKLNDVATNIYYSLGKLDSAFNKAKEANRLFVEMTNIRNEENILALEAKYDNANKLNEINLLKAQNTLVAKEKRNQISLLITVLIITFMIAVFLFFLYRNRQKTNTKLRELDTFKTNLFTNISHELRTPLTLISGPVEKQLNDPNTPLYIKETLLLVEHNSKRLQELINQMTDLAKVDTGQLRLEVTYVDAKRILEQLLAVFQYQASRKNIRLSHNLKLRGKVWLDTDIFQKIVSNVLSNSIKHAANNSEVVVQSVINNEVLEFSISNEVDNVDTINLNRLFDRFYQVDKSVNGMGVGLALVRELVTLHKGVISVEKVKERTILFKFELPVSKKLFNDEELKEMEHVILDKEEGLNEEASTEKETEFLLVVEDNPEIRAFVVAIFRENYSVIEAKNGREGLEKALELIPDIIISDIMLPEMNGLELTKTLKTDERTSHIPIVLLTAKVSDNDILEGVSAGADDYMIKPFKVSLLKTKVAKLIAMRRQLQLRFSQEVVLRPADVVVTPLEELFLEKLQVVLDNKLTDTSFNSLEFSKAMGMSRMQLHRKLKALTGQSTSEFIRSQRLIIAARLLKNSDTIISQVGYAVGFNDPSYFSRCFKGKYGCTPTEFTISS